MHKIFSLCQVILLSLVAQCTYAAAHESAASSSMSSAAGNATDMEEVIVTGEWAGPRLWKVSTRGAESGSEHVLWILGTLQPLPKKMIWQSKEVAEVITESQQVIGNTSIKPNVSWFGLLPLYLQVRHLSKLPENQTLHDVLPPELYVRFAALKQQYAAHDNELDKLRPMAAAARLYQDAVDSVGLTTRNDVQAMVIKLAKDHDVKVRDLTIKVDEPREVLKQVDQLPRAAEVACLAATITRLETDLPVMKRRAAAWATGDVKTLRQLVNDEQRTTCGEALLSAPRVQAVRAQTKASWFTAARDALAHNKSTLALSPINDLLGTNGTLEQFRAAGYDVSGS